MNDERSEFPQPSRRLLATLAVATLVVGLTGCAGTSAREYLDDSEITAKIKSDFASDKTVSALDIHVTTTDGRVRLSGTAKSRAERSRAVHIARSVSGVRSVTDDIKLKSD
jgi:hyperosmotically inducible periplasmic protein